MAHSSQTVCASQCSRSGETPVLGLEVCAAGQAPILFTERVRSELVTRLLALFHGSELVVWLFALFYSLRGLLQVQRADGASHFSGALLFGGPRLLHKGLSGL